MKLLILILGLVFCSSSFALLEGYIPITDQATIASHEDVLSKGTQTTLLLARNDPNGIIKPTRYQLWTLHEFGYQNVDDGTVFEIIGDVAESGTGIPTATFDCVLFQNATDASFIFLSYKIDPIV